MKVIPMMLVLGVLSLVTGCSDTVESRYATRSDAEADALFERGWLPAIIPSSSREIVMKNDLDLNLSNGQFFFSPADADDFRRHLSGVAEPGTGYSAFTYSENRATWFFEVDFTNGHCRYSSTWDR
jgi:hypothetical protein